MGIVIDREKLVSMMENGFHLIGEEGDTEIWCFEEDYLRDEDEYLVLLVPKEVLVWPDGHTNIRLGFRSKWSGSYIEKPGLGPDNYILSKEELRELS